MRLASDNSFFALFTALLFPPGWLEEADLALVIKLMAVLPIIFFLSTLEGSTIWCGVASWPVWIESSRSSSGATLLFSSAGEEGGRVLSTWAVEVVASLDCLD